jgi:hypothetical protein
MPEQETAVFDRTPCGVRAGVPSPSDDAGERLTFVGWWEYLPARKASADRSNGQEGG